MQLCVQGRCNVEASSGPQPCATGMICRCAPAHIQVVSPSPPRCNGSFCSGCAARRNVLLLNHVLSDFAGLAVAMITFDASKSTNIACQECRVDPASTTMGLNLAQPGQHRLNIGSAKAQHDLDPTGPQMGPKVAPASLSMAQDGATDGRNMFQNARIRKHASASLIFGLMLVMFVFPAVFAWMRVSEVLRVVVFVGPSKDVVWDTCVLWHRRWPNTPFRCS